MNAQNKLIFESKKKVLEALMQKSPQTYSELLQATGVSSRTLTKTLNRLQKEGAVYRQIQANAEKYPPPVVYGLTPEGRKTLVPFIFSTTSFWWAMGYKVEKPRIVNVKVGEEGDVKKGVLFKGETLSLAEMLWRLFFRALYALIKYFETKNADWLDCAQTPLALNPLMLQFLGYKGEISGFQKTEQYIQGIGVGSMFFEAHFTQEDINEIKRQVQKHSKDEWRKLEEFYKASLNFAEKLEEGGVKP